MTSIRQHPYLCILFLLVPAILWTTSAAAYTGGSGSAADPYQLAGVADLSELSSTPADWGLCFVMTTDVDLGREPLNPIGDAATPFSGIFDGANHRIKNLLVYDSATDSGGTGLFGVVDAAGATVTGTILEMPLVIANSQDDAGALIGRLVSGRVIKCGVLAGQVFGSISADSHVGGLIGANAAGSVVECWATALVEGPYTCGGLVGLNEANGLIRDCYAAGRVVARALNLSPNGQDFLAGGLTGLNNGSVWFCYSNGPIDSLNASGDSSGCMGGLFGAMAASAYPSPFVFSCFCDVEVCAAPVGCGELASGSVTAVTSAEMAEEKTFSGWDFGLTWYIRSETPRLQWQNQAPVAEPNDSRLRVTLPATDKVIAVRLDGSPSYDPDGDSLTDYSWTWSRDQAEYSASGSLVDVDFPAGTHIVYLVVSDGIVDSLPTECEVIVNTQPTAHAKAAKAIVTLPDPIELDAGESFDPDGDSLTYSWRICPVNGGACVTASGLTPTIQLPAGRYECELIVNDGQVDSKPAAIATVRVNTAPTAKMEELAEIVPPVTAGSACIPVDGTLSSDPDSDPLSYEWAVYRILDGTRQGSPIRTSINPQDTFCLEPGTYDIELIVSDGVVDSAPIKHQLKVNTAPVAIPCEDVEVFDDGMGSKSVTLTDGGSYDPDPNGVIATYTWSYPTATPPTITGKTVTMVFPVGVHDVNLVVNDGIEDSVAGEMHVTVTASMEASRTAVSPEVVGRSSQIDDVKFYLMLPSGTGVQDIDRTQAICLRINGTEIQCVQDPTYDHKDRTVVAVVDRETLLAHAGEDGSKTAMIIVRLTSDQAVLATIPFKVTSGSGPSPAAVALERLAYYMSSDWK